MIFSTRITEPNSIAGLLLAAIASVVSMAVCGIDARAATVDRYWQVSPYRVQVLVDYEVSQVWHDRLAATLPELLRNRVRAAFGPLWKLSIESAPDSASRPPADRLIDISDDQLTALRRDYDKVIALRVRESLLGFEVAAQEHDCLLEEWGPIWSSDSRDGAAVPELAFDCIRRAFTPMATFRVIRETPEKVEMNFRGANLPGVTERMRLVAEGAVFRPIVRRVDRDGVPVENGIQHVPWTFLTLDSMDDGTTTATIVSHTRSPLAARQRGRVDQLAAFVRPGNEQTRLRLHARDKVDQPLAGFKVFQRDTGVEDQEFIGKTDDDGAIEVAAGETPVQIVFVQAGGQWIAKIPVVPGTDGTVNAPLMDDRSRLEAEARLVSIQEELIDLVARRNILAFRTRAKIKAGDVDGANALIRQLEGMRTAAEFEQQRIRPQERMITSSDPRIQQRIEKMFSDTRDVLGEFLAPGLVQQLRSELANSSSAQR
ncbi:hypothetical protein [Aeoliella sp.]|uniref:hypothetical protein n=1 Tax=Aeoliella sp. TaxID=2795800 RepID=UPI003CCC0787